MIGPAALLQGSLLGSHRRSRSAGWSRLRLGLLRGVKQEDAARRKVRLQTPAPSALPCSAAAPCHGAQESDREQRRGRRAERPESDELGQR